MMKNGPEMTENGPEMMENGPEMIVNYLVRVVPVVVDGLGRWCSASKLIFTFGTAVMWF